MGTMKKISASLALCFFLFGTYQRGTAAFQYHEKKNYSEQSLGKSLNVAELFVVYFNSAAEYEHIPESYKYIQLLFRNVPDNSTLSDALKKGVYMDFIKNAAINLPLKQTASEDLFEKMIKADYDEELNYTSGKPLVLDSVLEVLSEIYNQNRQTIDLRQIAAEKSYEITKASNFPILDDVFTKLKYTFIDSDKLTDEALVQWAIKGMAEVTKDKHTAYFPPAEAASLNAELSGEFEGIGAYVDMTKPGRLEIVSPIAGTPAEKAGLKGGDVIQKIDDFAITETTTTQDAVEKIKGPAGTEVKLTIERGTETLIITVVRAKISVSFVNYKKLENGDSYIQITTFGVGSYQAFAQAITAIEKDPNAGKIILDLRNNPGGSLDEVSEMLNFFVPKDQSVVNIAYKNTSSSIYSIGSDFKNVMSKKIIILINGGSASASEIMAGTMRDYLPNVKIIGETSYGKGSVQSLDSYSDGSSFKYTIAKWYTGKTNTGIDGAGIKPDIELKFDEEKWKNGEDNQLQYAKTYVF